MSISCYHCRIVASHIRGRTHYVTVGLSGCCSERCTPTDFLASEAPPSYADISSTASTGSSVVSDRSRLHPRVAVVLGVNARWHTPLLICRALSTAPAAWWGLRCAFTFLAELLFSDGMGILHGDCWTVEKRFRVTEVFLAILWVRCLHSNRCRSPHPAKAHTRSAPPRHTYPTHSPTALCLDGLPQIGPVAPLLRLPPSGCCSTHPQPPLSDC